MKETLLTKFQNRNAHVAVIGLGYVGLPLAVSFAQAGYQVTGIDLDERKVDAINRGESYIEDIPSAEVAALVSLAEAEQVGALAIEGTEQTASTALSSTPRRGNNAALGRLAATTDYAVLAECDAVSICVPTPLNKTGDPDISFIVTATEAIARYLHPGMVVVLESTTYPGTTTEVMLPRMEANGQALQVGQDFFLAFSPERVDFHLFKGGP